jgi:hypothetical protein
MDIHQCPRCELRFVHTSELRHHFQFDHAGDPRVLEPYRYRSSATGAPDRTILLVGNQSLGRDGVLEEVAQRAAGGARVFVLVPATAVGPGEDAGAALAGVRLHTMLERLRAAGVDADGEVGAADPFAAICEVLGREDVEEILISTLPPSTSRWLSVDLPDRLRRHSSRPVSVLTPLPTEV